MQSETLEVTLPSSRKITIRELNGNDESALSTIGMTESGESINAFLANIIVSEPKPVAKDIAKWPCADRYYLLLKQRIFNQGSELTFKHTDPTDTEKRAAEYTEDLSLIDGDLSDPNYTPTDVQIRKYPHGTDEYVEKTFEDRKFRFKIMTGEMEEKQNRLPDREKNINTLLTARELEEWANGQWLKKTSFHDCKVKLMRDLRTWVTVNDPVFAPVITVINPYTNNPLVLGLMFLKDFFFPEGTI
jgi:hypothetical protein